MKISMILLTFVVLGAFMSVITCDDNSDDNTDDSSDDVIDDDDDDTDPSSDDTDDNPECDSNHAPELLSLAIRINGEPVDMPATVYGTDKLELIFDYRDPDCNLDGGAIQFLTSWGTLTDDSFGLDGIGCSSDEEGEPFVKEIDPDLLNYVDSIYMYLMDICGDTSNHLPLDIEVI